MKKPINEHPLLPSASPVQDPTCNRPKSLEGAEDLSLSPLKDFMTSQSTLTSEKIKPQAGKAIADVLSASISPCGSSTNQKLTLRKRKRSDDGMEDAFEDEGEMRPGSFNSDDDKVCRWAQCGTIFRDIPELR
jgi:hypothetical protein